MWSEVHLPDVSGSLPPRLAWDGRRLVIATRNRLSVCNTQTDDVRELLPDRRLMASVFYSLGFLLWPVLWGLARRRKRPTADAQSRVPAGVIAPTPVPPRRLKRCWGLLVAGGLLAVVPAVLATIYLRDYWPWWGCCSLGAGTLAIARGVARADGGLRLAAGLLLFTAALPIGLRAVWLAGRPDVRRWRHDPVTGTGTSS